MLVENHNVLPLSLRHDHLKLLYCKSQLTPRRTYNTLPTPAYDAKASSYQVTLHVFFYYAHIYETSNFRSSSTHLYLAWVPLQASQRLHASMKAKPGVHGACETPTERQTEDSI